MASFIGFIKRVYTANNPPNVPKTSDSKPIKFGILGAAAITPGALIYPAISHPDAVVYAVAARDKARAESFAKKHGILKVYSGTNGYQELLNDSEIDAVYNPLPNGFHYEWTMKALAAGKHVLLEKPSADTAEETQKMFELSERKGLVLLEAFHYRFHPAIQRVKQILDSGDLGAIRNISANLAIPNILFKADDIRYDYSLGGGAMMDMGCYTINCIRYLTSSNLMSVVDVDPIVVPPKMPSAHSLVDRAMTAVLRLSNNITATLKADLGVPFTIIPSMPEISTVITCEGGEVELYNFIAPTIYHRIRVTTKGGDGEKSKVKDYKIYRFPDGEGRGEDWWTTYRYQLEAFVDKVKGRKPQTWITAEDSVQNMRWIEDVYAKSGLGSRPPSNFVLEE